jgi:hypothetical protein
MLSGVIGLDPREALDQQRIIYLGAAMTRARQSIRSFSPFGPGPTRFSKEDTELALAEKMSGQRWSIRCMTSRRT